jgi:hypothetical protein
MKLRTMAMHLAAGLLLLVPALASAQHVTGTFGFFVSPNDNVTITFACSGGPTCTGTYGMAERATQCTNVVNWSDVLIISGLNLSASGAISGGVTLRRADRSLIQNQDGTCTPSPGSTAPDVVMPYTGTWNLANQAATFSVNGGDVTLYGAFASGSDSSQQSTGRFRLFVSANETLSFAYACTGTPACTGAYIAVERAPQCSNSVVSSDTYGMTGLNLAQSGALSGNVTMAKAQNSFNQAGGTCTIAPGATDAVLPYTGNWNLANKASSLTVDGGGVNLLGSFAADARYTVTPGAGANGTISPDTPVSVLHGSGRPFTITPTPGYEIDTVSGCGGTMTASNIYRTGGVTANCAVNATFKVANPPRMSNISTRMQVQTGSDVMIGGFVIGGGSNKAVAIVATGPSLSAFGITNPLANPTLRLVRSSDQAVLATNDDWQAGCPQPSACANPSQLTAAGFAPSDPLEAAMHITLAPGAYTAIVEGVGGGAGVGVIGVYEVDGPHIPLSNISTRGKVLTGSDVMIGGFVITGTGPQTVAIVATGPSLAAFGITGPLANPTVRIVRSSDQAVIDTNDDWGTHANAGLLQAAGFAPTNPVEAAIYTTLQPGAYTAIVEGVGGGTGVAVIGVYKVN